MSVSGHGHYSSYSGHDDAAESCSGTEALTLHLGEKELETPQTWLFQGLKFHNRIYRISEHVCIGPYLRPREPQILVICQLQESRRMHRELVSEAFQRTKAPGRRVGLQKWEWANGSKPFCQPSSYSHSPFIPFPFTNSWLMDLLPYLGKKTSIDRIIHQLFAASWTGKPQPTISFFRRVM